MAATLRPFFDELCDHAVQAGAKLRCAIGLLKQGMIIAVHAADAHLLSKFFLFSRVSLLSLVNSFFVFLVCIFSVLFAGGDGSKAQKCNNDNNVGYVFFWKGWTVSPRCGQAITSRAAG